MHHNYAIMFITFSLVLVATAGCEMSSHAENKQAALDRWTSARTGILYSMAMQQFESGDLHKAERTATEILEIDSDHPAAWELAGRIKLEQGQLERAYTSFERALSFADDRASTHYWQGVVHQRWQQYDHALNCYQHAFALQPDQIPALLASAEMMVALDQPGEAAALLREKLVYFEHNAAIRVALGRIQMMRGESHAAVQSLKEACLLNSEDTAARAFLATALIANRDYTEALQTLDNLLDDSDLAQRVDLHLKRARCLHAMDRLVDARQAYLNITQRFQGNADAWIGLAELALQQGEFQLAVEAALRAQNADARRYEPYFICGLVAKSRGQTEAALRWFQRAATQSSKAHAAPYIMQGLMYQELGQLAKASQAYRQAHTIDPQDSRPARLLAALNAPSN